MRSNLLKRVVGESVSQPVRRAPKPIKNESTAGKRTMLRVLGEDTGSSMRADQRPSGRPERPPLANPDARSAALPPPDADPSVGEMGGRPPGGPGGEEGMEQPGGGNVEALAAAWQSGSQMDVAYQIASNKLPYSDLVTLFYMIGQEQALSLGQMLDEISASQEQEEQPQGQSMVDRVTGGGGGGGPEAEAAPSAPPEAKEGGGEPAEKKPEKKPKEKPEEE